MKKLIIFGLVIALAFTGILLMQKEGNKSKLKESPYDKEDLHQETVNLIGNENYKYVVTPTEFKERLEEGGEFIGYFFSPTCVYCVEMTPVLMPILEEEGIEVLQYNMLEYEALEYEVTGTPTTIYFKDGKEVDRMVGLRDETIIRDFLEYNK